MTTKLDKAIAKARRLSVDRQDELANVVEAFVLFDAADRELSDRDVARLRARAEDPDLPMATDAEADSRLNKLCSWRFGAPEPPWTIPTSSTRTLPRTILGARPLSCAVSAPR
jgi:hypothetical protein